jgi:hypothetical protein
MFTFPGAHLTSILNQSQQLFTILARWFPTGDGAEENGQLGDELFVFEDIMVMRPASTAAASFELWKK